MSPEAVEQHLVVRKTARTYRLGEPGPATREVWIACHGYGQLAARFIRSFQSIAGESRVVVAPEALHRFYLDPPDRPAEQRRVGATWMTRDDRDRDIADYVAYLDDVCAEVRGAAPSASITALGFSQGAATVSRWAVASDLPLARAGAVGLRPARRSRLAARAPTLRRDRAAPGDRRSRRVHDPGADRRPDRAARAPRNRSSMDQLSGRTLDR